MSSSDEDVIRRPGRSTGAGQPGSPSASEHSEAPARSQSPAGSDAGNANGYDDADLFGSDASDGGFGDDNEYGQLPLLLERHSLTSEQTTPADARRRRTRFRR